MNILCICPCCYNTMLHHIRNHREYWFCRNCWQEMPDLKVIKENKQHRPNQLVNLSAGLSQLLH